MKSLPFFALTILLCAARVNNRTLDVPTQSRHLPWDLTIDVLLRAQIATYYRDLFGVRRTRNLGPSPRALAFNRAPLVRMPSRSLRTAKVILSMLPTVIWTGYVESPTIYSTGEELLAIYLVL